MLCGFFCLRVFVPAAKQFVQHMAHPFCCSVSHHLWPLSKLDYISISWNKNLTYDSKIRRVVATTQENTKMLFLLLYVIFLYAAKFSTLCESKK